MAADCSATCASVIDRSGTASGFGSAVRDLRGDDLRRGGALKRRWVLPARRARTAAASAVSGAAAVARETACGHGVPRISRCIRRRGVGGQQFRQDKTAAAALRAVRHGRGGDLLNLLSVAVGNWLGGGGASRLRQQQAAAELQLVCASAIGQEAVVADL